MYDDSIGSSNYSNVHRHWYDEPPYESDPDDFLMTGMGAAAKIQVRHMERRNFCRTSQATNHKSNLSKCLNSTFISLISSRAVVFVLRQTDRE